MSFLTNLFGKTKVDPVNVDYTPPGFSGGGLTGGFSGNNYNVTASPERAGLVNNISSVYSNLGDITGGLRQSVAPGYNDLLASRLAAINTAATKSIGDLRQNLQSRRILGSSFGQDTIGRMQSEFGQQRDAVIADTFLKSLEASNQLLKQQYDAYSKGFTNKLNELNLQAGMATELSGKASAYLAQNAQLEAKLNADAAQFNAKMSNSQGQGFGQLLFGAALAPFTGGMSLLPSAGFTSLGSGNQIKFSNPFGAR